MNEHKDEENDKGNKVDYYNPRIFNFNTNYEYSSIKNSKENGNNNNGNHRGYCGNEDDNNKQAIINENTEDKNQESNNNNEKKSHQYLTKQYQSFIMLNIQR